jgi:K+/H+ antiporter YhaU regulatory subunit KhtT
VANFKLNTHLKIVALKRNQEIIYSSSQLKEDLDIAELEFKQDDVLVLVGEMRDIQKFLQS